MNLTEKPQRSVANRSALRTRELRVNVGLLMRLGRLVPNHIAIHTESIIRGFHLRIGNHVPGYGLCRTRLQMLTFARGLADFCPKGPLAGSGAYFAKRLVPWADKAHLGRMCEACQSGPKGIAGHEALALSADRDRNLRPIFRCTHCGASWIREYTGAGDFVWRTKPAPSSVRERV